MPVTAPAFQNDPFVTLAHVSKTQGRIGEVACVLHTDFPQKFAERKTVLLFDPRSGTRTPTNIENHWFHKGLVILKFAGVDSITAGERLIGMQVQIPEAERAPLAAGAYYISDLIGCVLFDKDLRLGTIRAVNIESPSAPLLIVAVDPELEVPFAEAYLNSIDLAAKEVRMALPPGLLDINS